MILYDLGYTITDLPHFFDPKHPIESITFAGAVAECEKHQMLIVERVISEASRRDWTDETATYHAITIVSLGKQSRAGASSWKNHPKAKRFAELDSFRNAVRMMLLQENI